MAEISATQRSACHYLFRLTGVNLNSGLPRVLSTSVVRQDKQSVSTAISSESQRKYLYHVAIRSSTDRIELLPDARKALVKDSKGLVTPRANHEQRVRRCLDSTFFIFFSVWHLSGPGASDDSLQIRFYGHKPRVSANGLVTHSVDASSERGLNGVTDHV